VTSDLEDRVANLGLVPETNIEWMGIVRVVKSFVDGATKTGDRSMVWGERRAFHAARGIESLVYSAYNTRRLQPSYTISAVVLPNEERPMPFDVGNRMTDAYENRRFFSGWTSHLLPVAAFDAETTEWRLADILDRSSRVSWWLRLQSSDPVYIETESGRYYPDFIALEKDTGVRWVLEGKSNKDLEDPGVQAKRRAALEWAATVNAEEKFGVWKYLLCSESAIRYSSGNWETLLTLAGMDTAGA
jgi:type III restriction enzyme